MSTAVKFECSNTSRSRTARKHMGGRSNDVLVNWFTQIRWNLMNLKETMILKYINQYVEGVSRTRH
jgi:hypothetical protein